MATATESPHTVPLSSAAPGQVLRVCDVLALGDDGIRLKRMGICVGRPLELVRAGDPMILQVVGTRVGISRQLAATVLVQSWSFTAEPEPTAEATVGSRRTA